MTIYRLNDVLGNNNIFSQIMTEHTCAWAGDTDITAALLDFEYRYNFSGHKIVAPALELNIDGDTELLTDSAFELLCNIAYMMYNKKWARNWAVLTAEYNPIENYSMTEETNISRDNTETNSGTDTTAHTGTDTTAVTGTETLAHTGTDTTAVTGTEALAHTGTISDSGSSSDETEVSAFNSSSYEDSSEVSSTASNTKTFNDTETTTHNTTNTETLALTDTTTHNTTNTETLALNDALTHGHVVDNEGTESIEHTRSGNIGITTSQQMLQSDIELWKWNFFYEVFKDIDTIFTITTY